MTNSSNNTVNTIASILNIPTRATLMPVEEVPSTTFKESKNKNDSETSAEIIKDSIDRSVDMLKQVQHIAVDTQNPRFFEAFTELFKSIVTANKEFVETKQIAKGLEATSLTPLQDGVEPGTARVQQITMTTADFAKLLNKHRGNNEDGG